MPDVLDEWDLRHLLIDCQNQLDEVRGWHWDAPYRTEWLRALEEHEIQLNRKLSARTGKLAGVTV